MPRTTSLAPGSGPGAFWLVTSSRFGRNSRAAALAFLVVALGVGIPVRGHAHHDGDQRHVGSPEHAHGLQLVQFEMRLERAAAPEFAFVETPVLTVACPSPTRILDLPADDGGLCDSRAPPTPRTRAPPA